MNTKSRRENSIFTLGSLSALFITFVVLATVTLPSVHAVDVNLGMPIAQLNTAMTTIYGTISSIFNVEMSEQVLTGVLKFLFFLLTFSLFFWAGKKTIWRGDGALDNRTAGIVAFALSLTATLFIPKEFFMDVTSIWPALVVLLLILAIPAICVGVAFLLLGGKDAGAFKHVLGAVLIGFAWVFLNIFQPKALAYAAGGSRETFGTIVFYALSWILIFLPILLLVKLVLAIFAGFKGGGSSGAAGAGGGIVGALKRGADKLIELDKTGEKLWDHFVKTKIPNNVSGITFTVLDPVAKQVKLTWDDPHASDVDHFDIQWSNVDQTTCNDDKKNHQPPKPNYIQVPGDKFEHVFALPTSLTKDTHFRIRAVNKSGEEGRWEETAHVPPIAPVVFRDELDKVRADIVLGFQAQDRATDILTRFKLTTSIANPHYPPLRQIGGVLAATYPITTVADSNRLATLNTMIANIGAYIGRAQTRLGSIASHKDFPKMTPSEFKEFCDFLTQVHELHMQRGHSIHAAHLVIP